MKTILITIGNTFQARDLLRSDFFELFKKNKSIKLVLLVPAEKLSIYKSIYSGDNIVIEAYPLVKDKLNKFETLAYLLGHHSIPSDTMRILHQRLKDRHVVYVLRNLAWLLGHLRLWREFVRWLFSLSTNGEHFLPLFNKYKPDLVYAVNLLNFDEFRLIHQAKKLGVKTCALILSWDNLNSKLFMYSKADNYIVPGKIVKEELIDTGDIKENKICMTGLVKYDGYFRKEGVVKKGKFFQDLGIPIDNKLVVYCLSTKNTSPAYEDIFEDLISIKNKVKGGDKISWVIRGYPKYDLLESLISKMRKEGFIYNHPSDFSEGDYEIKSEDDVFLHNLFYHADLFITNYSTVVVEASIYDKPVININYDGKIQKPYPRSIKRIRDYTHYKQVIEAGAEDYANNKEELLLLIEKSLKAPGLRREGRARVVEEQCAFIDGQAGRRMYDYLVYLAHAH